MQAIVAFVLLFPLAAAAPSTPISRVTELLTNLAAQIEKDASKEETLYETFVCWGKGVISSKTASNAAAEDRISSQKKYIADIEAGRIEFTSERQDLEKDLEQVNADIELSTEMRAKEKSDFESARDEMGQAIAALSRATEVLGEATEEHKTGTLLSLRGRRGGRRLGVSEASEATAELAAGAELVHAADLGDRFLSKGDAVFLRRLLTGEVPTADWKKLNRKATFKMSYKARSFKIQDVLAKLHSTFQSNLDEATAKEEAAVKTYDTLMAAKNAQKQASEEALAKMEQENGARGMSKEDAQAEVDALTKQVEDDTRYIAQVTATLATKKQEWKDRQALRAGEIAAISKAISILHSDDARDLMKKTFKSQGYSLLQASALTGRRAGAFTVLQKAARISGDRRLKVLAARLGAPSHFAEVVDAIDSMLATLANEENADLEKKETCETNRAADARKAITLSRGMDEMSDKIARLTSEIADHNAEIADDQQQITDILAELAEATKIRDAEHAEYVVSKKDDEDAKTVVGNARSVLETFYSENGLMLQVRQVQKPGEAPPPPPATWEAPYGGKTNEATGILEVLAMVEEDIAKDIAKADAEEAAADSAYKKVKADLEASKAGLEQAIVTLNAQVAEKEQDIEATKTDKRMNKDELTALLKAMAAAAPGCDFFVVNYEVRRTNRQTEIDGLNKAKAILEGASFTKNTDATREIKPGDALL